MNVINIEEKFLRITEHWKPAVITRLNDYAMKIVKVQGEFVWHKHDETDELFIVHKGKLELQMRDRTVYLSQGDVFVVPRGVEHRPVAHEECEFIMLEPEATSNTGNVGGERTVKPVEL